MGTAQVVLTLTFAYSCIHLFLLEVIVSSHLPSYMRCDGSVIRLCHACTQGSNLSDSGDVFYAKLTQKPLAWVVERHDAEMGAEPAGEGGEGR